MLLPFLFLPFPTLHPFLQSHLHEAPYTAEEIESLLGSPLSTIFASSPSSLRVVEAAPNYKLQQVGTRARLRRDANSLTSFSLSHSPTLSRTHSNLLTHSLTHSLTHPLTH